MIFTQGKSNKILMWIKKNTQLVTIEVEAPINLADVGLEIDGNCSSNFKWMLFFSAFVFNVIFSTLYSDQTFNLIHFFKLLSSLSAII